MTDHLMKGSAIGHSPIVAAALSTLLPGAGQWYGGRRVRGVVFAAWKVDQVLEGGVAEQTRSGESECGT